MKAVVHERYGPPEVLRIADVERPAPADNEVLVRVHASTVSRGDTEMRTLEYPFSRLFTGIRRPKRTIAGTEFAGIVEEVGAGVTELRVGDEVFGFKGGANAEYLAVPEDGVIALKPTGLTFEEATAVPDGSLLALTMLQPIAPLREKSVLVYGAAGSIGTSAVQLLVHLRGRGDGGVRHEGRRGRSVARRGGGHRSPEQGLHEERQDVRRDLRCRRQALVSPQPALTEAGRDLHHRRLGFMYHVPLLALGARIVGSRRAKLGIGRYRKEELLLVKELVDVGKYRPVIDRTYELEEVVEANRYVETGQKTGNVVLRVRKPRP